MTMLAAKRQGLEVVAMPAKRDAPLPPPGLETFDTDSRALRRRVLASLSVVALLVGGLGGWGSTAELSGAVITSGQLVVDGSVKKVQHLAGGIVKDIRVANGDVVEAGEIILTLDQTQTRATLDIIRGKLVELESQRARLLAERDGRDRLDIPSSTTPRTPEELAAFTSEQRLLTARITGWRSQKDRLGERIEQARKEIEALTAQREAKERELGFIRKELAMVEDLRRKDLANAPRLIAMQREVARFEGEHGALLAQIARIESHAKEIEISILELDQKVLSEAEREMRAADGHIAELREREIASLDQVQRTELRAPVSGVVHELSAQTVGGVVRAGEPVALIVPNEDILTAEVRINPADIDQVAVGQTARVRLSALNQRTTPELEGSIRHVGADLTREASTGREYFVGRIGIDRAAAEALRDVKLVAGMPVEGFIATGERTALSYFLKPFQDHLERAFRED